MAQAMVLGVTIVVTAALIVLGALAIFAGLWRGTGRADLVSAMPDQDAVFIFRDDRLIDCSDAGRKLLSSIEGSRADGRKPSTLSLLRGYLAPHFPALDTALADLPYSGQFELASATEDGLVLTARLHKGLTRLHLNDPTVEGALLAIDRLSFDAMQAELASLRSVVRHSPALIWKTDAQGQVIWANTAYIRVLQQSDAVSSDLTWPLPALFEMASSSNDTRISCQRDDCLHWFAHSRFSDGAHDLHFAIAIDETVQSEAARHQTLQTLTRTFATLPIGLALFDAERRLQIFNPALVDLTGMDPIFLAARPSFEQILYCLREKRMLPEPKDFNDWRRELIEMEKAAETGEYAEEWCLDGGRTFHVTGRPQPNGAIALFIEDVTTEAALTRSFRSEIEVVHKVLDGMSEGIAVFGMTGQSLLANDAYIRLWQNDPCATLADAGLGHAIGLWSGRCEPTTFWARLAEFVSQADAPDEISGTATLRSGMPLALRARHLPGGVIMLVFQPIGTHALSQRPDFAKAADLLRSSDLAAPGCVHARAQGRPEIEVAQDAARKARSARHSGTRVRA